jgi:hypothetical protein
MKLGKSLVRWILPAADWAAAPMVYLGAQLLGLARKAGIQRMPFCKGAMLRAGVFPLLNHYYEPQFDFRNTELPPDEGRQLPGIDWNLEGQLELLQKLKFSSELETEQPSGAGRQFDFNNDNFKSGDAEYWYQMVRFFKPARIFEVGSGNSTLLAIRAAAANRRENNGYKCRHVCIEPYEMQWLEQTGVEVIRRRVEDLPLSFFSELEANDILFIDSSHVIRPAGDVLYEFLHLLPSLNPGVIVHIHDIFSPRNYPRSWFQDQVRLWNEQYLLEAFLCHNKDWKILGALNLLKHHHFSALQAVAPFLTSEREPGSFYIQRAG